MSMRIAWAAAICAGCAMGPPPGFSQGTLWTFPLVDPLSDGRLVTTISVNGKGPFLVAIDPDAPVTVLDSAVIAGGFRAASGPRRVDESDVSHPEFYVTVINVQVGDLAITQRTVMVGPHDAFSGDGRQLFGVIGRDIIADSLAFGFDRERGIAWLETEDTLKPPAGALVLPYEKGTRRRPDLVIRRLVSAEVDGAKYDLHLDLGAATSSLRQEHWREAKLEVTPHEAHLVDELGIRRDTDTAGIAARVTAGPVSAERIAFVPYDDRRWDFGQLEGTLGLDFFRPYSVIADWHHERYYLTPRAPSPEATTQRLARWGDAIPAACRATGCVTTRLADQDGALVAVFDRDPAASGRPLEVVFAATAASGERLPDVFVNLGPGADHVDAAIDARYRGATLSVADASPFPFRCTGCVLTAASP